MTKQDRRILGAQVTSYLIFQPYLDQPPGCLGELQAMLHRDPQNAINSMCSS